MIKFFRKIRYNLMETGKTTKYIKYAIGEIALVMIGILLALQVNNWNTQRINKQTENDNYCQLALDFESDKAELLKLIEASRQREATSKQLLLDLDARTKTKEELLKGFFFVMRSDAFIPSKATITELISSGTLSLIKNRSLRKQLLTFYEFLDNKVDIADSNRNLMIDNIMNWDSIIEFGWQDLAVGNLDAETRQTLPFLDWHLDKDSPYYARYQETLIIAIGITTREQELYTQILSEMEPLLKRLNSNCK